MRIIYEDGSTPEKEKSSTGEIEFEDISSVSPPAGKPKTIRRPAPTIRPATPKQTHEKPKVQQSEVASFNAGPDGAPPVAVYPAPPYNQGMPTGYPVQGYPVQGYVPVQGQYPPVQGYAPNQYPYGQFAYPTQSVQPQQPTAAEGTAGANPGTRVIYQSHDFDNHESKGRQTAPAYSQPTVMRGIEQEEVDYSEENFPALIIKSKSKAPSKPAPDFFTKEEDEIEMSVFELNAISGGRQANAKLVSQPIIMKKGINEESFEREIEAEEELQQTVGSVKPAGVKKKLATSEIIRRVILALSIVAIVAAVGMLAKEGILSIQNKQLEDDVSDLIIDVAPVTRPTEPDVTEKDEVTEKEEATEPTTAPLTPEQQWAKIKAEYPDVIFPPYLQLKYAKLYATNQDFVGYLSADGVNLNLPIVQTDNDEDYMKKNFYGKSTKYGCPFVTHLNNVQVLDTNTVIFGHHMNDGTVFGALDKYKSIEGFKKAPVITFNTIYNDYQWKVIAAFVTNALPEDDNGYLFRYYFTGLSTQERYAAYLNELSQRSLYDTGVDVLPTDKILTLSTCSHEFKEARFVVVARLVRHGETAEVDVSKATVNPNPRYPQAYYDKKGKDNPYKEASRWEVG